MRFDELNPKRVFKYFEEICHIPHGSGDMKRIADYCEAFAMARGLKYVRDNTNSIIIYKHASKGYEAAEPIILQGHLDMVCQQNDGVNKNFLTDGIEPYIDGDFVKAKGTSLGADNGIAVSMILAILESDEYEHPEIQAVFTTDEETGMFGAAALDYSLLSAKRMINLDAEEDDTVTVSCAGGSNFNIKMPITREKMEGVCVNVTLKGLIGGHSGVEIHKGRINSNILAGRFLNELIKRDNAGLINIDGGDKANAITRSTTLSFCVKDFEEFRINAEKILNSLKNAISDREPNFDYDLELVCTGVFMPMTNENLKILNLALNILPNAVQNMSASIENLVETSLNMGILSTETDHVYMQYALRSNKSSELEYLEQRLFAFTDAFNFDVHTDGKYPPWEYTDNSFLQSVYKNCYKKLNGNDAKVAAIHAGLECGLFSASIKGLDCIAIGPAMFDVHTTSERLSISSTAKTFALLLEILKNCR